MNSGASTHLEKPGIPAFKPKTYFGKSMYFLLILFKRYKYEGENLQNIELQKTYAASMCIDSSNPILAITLFYNVCQHQKKM